MGTPGAAARAAEASSSNTRLLMAADNLIIDGIELTGTPPGPATIDGNGQNASQVVVRNTVIRNLAASGIYISGTGTRQDWTINANLFRGIGQTTGVMGTNPYSAMNLWNSNGMTVTNNVVDTVDYNGLNLDSVAGAVVTGNSLIDIGKSGIQLANACSGSILIENNSFKRCNKRYTLDQQYYYSAVKLWSGGSELTTSGDITVRNNMMRDCVVGFLLARPLNLGTNLLVESNIIADNSLAGFLQYQPAGQAVNVTANNWGDPTGPATGTFEFPVATGLPPDQAVQITGGGSGNPVLTNLGGGTSVTFSPWYADEAMTIPVTAANFQDIMVPEGDSVTEGDLYLGAGSTYTVNGALVVTGALTLADGATLEVIDGSLTINGSTLSGTFTFFNSLGSVNFNDDVAITGSADGLILVTDVHVADGATITVNGTLVIDGSVVDCQTDGGSYTIQVSSGASFTMARTVMTDGALNLAADDSKVYDSRFEASTVTVASGTDAASVFHNLTDSLGWLTDNGTGTVTSVDGWGNLDDPPATQNNLFLGLDPGTLVDLTNGRTVDGEGTLFIQPSDSITASVDISVLQSKISAVEVMLGYNTGLLGAAPLALESDWNLLLSDVDDNSTVIGKLDAAIGLRTTFADPAGSSADDTIAKVTLTGQAVEGETLFFHRVKLAGGAFGGETRLTTGGPSPSFLTPFTLNSASIVLDGSEPTVIVDSLVDATQVQVNEPSPVDVLDPAPSTPPAFAFRNGNPLVITFTASDAGLAGLDAADAANDLDLSASNGTTVLDSWTVAAAEDTLTGVVTYTVTLAVPTDATNGLYTVTADIRDRSGNWSGATDLGDFEVANELLATVELEGFAGGGRVVTFVATGGTPKTWIKTVTFTGTTGSVTLEDVPAGTTHVSAKTAWNLRSKVAVSFSPEGVGTANLTGTDRLPGGDLNGDNVVNTLDYSVLRYHWLAADPEADITGDADVTVGDYNLLKANFYTVGDPQ